MNPADKASSSNTQGWDATLERHHLNIDLYEQSPYVDIRNRFFPHPIGVPPSERKTELGRPEKFINSHLIRNCASQPPERVLEEYYLRLAYEIVSNEHHFPPIQKCAYLELIGRIYSLDVLVETGIFWGTTGLYLREAFSQIYTIDIDPVSCDLARRLFKNTRIEVFEGDSGKSLPLILDKINQDAVFFLDAHSANDTPVLEELAAIAAHHSKNHVIVIDDLACFSEYKGNYPSRERMRRVAEDLFTHHKIAFEVGFILLLPSHKDHLLKQWHERTEGTAVIWPRLAVESRVGQTGDNAHSSQLRDHLATGTSAENPQF